VPTTSNSVTGKGYLNNRMMIKACPKLLRQVQKGLRKRRNISHNIHSHGTTNSIFESTIGKQRASIATHTNQSVSTHMDKDLGSTMPGTKSPKDHFKVYLEGTNTPALLPNQLQSHHLQGPINFADFNPAK